MLIIKLKYNWVIFADVTIFYDNGISLVSHPGRSFETDGQCLFAAVVAAIETGSTQRGMSLSEWRSHKKHQKRQTQRLNERH